jgi:chromosome segregation ATPase
MSRKQMDELLIQLGELAREHFSTDRRGKQPKAMPGVLEADERAIALENEIDALEEAINEEDGGYQDFLERHLAERTENEEIAKKWKKAVQGIESRSRDLKKKIAATKATLRYERNNLKAAEAKHADLELSQAHDERKIALSKENLKKMRLQLMKKTRDIEEMERTFKSILTPKPGQMGAQGILAYKRLLEMEDEQEELKQEIDSRIEELSKKIGTLEDELENAELEFEDALYELGVECYENHIEHPSFAPIVAKLEKMS